MAPRLKDGLLRLMMRLEPTPFIREPLPGDYPHARGADNQYACFACPAALVHDGKNQLLITQTAGPDATRRYLDLVLPKEDMT